MPQALILHGDCRDNMRAMIERGMKAHSCVSDPPYGLISVVKRFGKTNAAPAMSNGPTGVFARRSAGFMGQTWDGTGVEKDPDMWRLVYDCLHPGAHLVAFGGTKTWHRIACAIEDAGFEIRDTIIWAFAQGMPHSHDAEKLLKKAIAAGASVEECLGMFEGWGTALKPALEPIILARKPLIGSLVENLKAFGTGMLNIDASRLHSDDAKGGAYSVRRRKPGAEQVKTMGSYRPDDRGEVFEGFQKAGRWPANLAWDGSAEVAAAFSPFDRMSRVFFCPKPRKFEKGEFNDHPTVKPLDLMDYLVKLVTPPGGTVLDPFMGSGTTGVAAVERGFDFIGFEMDPKYTFVARRRIWDVIEAANPDFAPTFAPVHVETGLAEACSARGGLTDAIQHRE